MSTYSSNLATTLISTGDQSGVWGNTTNYNLGTLMEQAISSYVTQQFNNADVTLTIVSGADAGGNTTPGSIYSAGTVAVPVSARNMYIECQGTSSGNNLIVPNNTKMYFIYNNITSGGGTITVKTGAGTGVAIPNGKRAAVVCNGTNVVQAENYFSTLTSPSVSLTGGAIDGTTVGATTATTVRGTTITATTQFTGPGTGLTGTAASLSIGGTAATATNLSGGSVAATTITASGSTVLGSPTGGSQGAGTLNATGLFVNGVAVGTGNGSVTSVSGTGSVSGLTLTGTVTTSGSLSLGGSLTLTSSQITTGLGYTPPTPTGTGASGTWGISISGNAANITAYSINQNLSTTSSPTFSTVYSGAFYYSSDERLKQGIEALANSNDIIYSLRPVSFIWSASGSKDYGLIAQEVKEVLPEAINENEQGYLTINSSTIMSHLIKVIQTQNERIAVLEQKIFGDLR